MQEFYATLDDSITQDNKTVSEMKLNVNVADNRATKVFNIAVSGQDDIASDEFHDAGKGNVMNIFTVKPVLKFSCIKRSDFWFP